ncbi:hypothetical protein GGI1_00755 [Acidithiobacillus sp. GGI-221]|nr:hypothetical protein GGI1_00755 [Acidithiobacillus sp. GGI-221]
MLILCLTRINLLHISIIHIFCIKSAIRFIAQDNLNKAVTSFLISDRKVSYIVA